MYTPRDVEKEINKYLDAKEIIAIVGTRQCGKTTLVKQIIKNLKNVNSLSFDNVKDLNLFQNDIDEFIALHVKPYDHLFIDEVQYAKDSGKKLKYIYDTQDIKIFITGSSAPELSIQSLKNLVGRIFLFTLHPFSFREYLRAKDEKLLSFYDKTVYGKNVLERINKHLKEYLIYGGYPRVVHVRSGEDKKFVLSNIYSTYLLREIKEILGISETEPLTKLVKALSLQIGNMINYEELSSVSGLSFVELKKQLTILEETYIIRRISTFHTNKRTELVKTPKVYFIDAGFRNTCIDNYSEERSDKGALIENFVFSELQRKGIETKYWRTKSGAEVDFIINEQTPIEVKQNVSNNTLTRSFVSFITKYSPKKAYIASLDYEDELKKEKTTVQFIPLAKLVQHNLMKDLEE